jgi:integrase
LSNSKSTKNAKGAGTIRKRSDGRWEARYSVGFSPKTGKQIQRSIYGDSQKEVRQKLAKVTTEIDEGIYTDPCNMKLGTWLDIWLNDYTVNLKPSTRSIYDSHVRTHLKPNLGQIQLGKLAPHMVQHLYNELLNEKGLSPKTIKNLHGALHRAMEQAKRLGYIRTNPLDAVIVPRVEKTKVETLADDEMLRFLTVIKGEPDELIYFVTVFTGLRQGEVLGLTWDCVDFENNTLLINKQHTQLRKTKEYVFASLKNDKIRTLTVADEVMDALRRQQAKQNAWAEAAGSAWSNPDQLVFTNELGRYVSNKTLYNRFKRLMKENGFDELRFHSLRHTFAVNSLRAGDDIKTVQENLGHATASFTLSTYAHSTPGMKKESANRMGQYIKSLQSNAE